MKFLILSVIVLVTTIIQASLMPYLSIMGVSGNLILAVVVSIALIKRKPYGSMIGLILGLIQDILFGQIIGLRGLIYFLIGAGLDNVELRVNRDDLYLPLLIMGLSSLAYNLLYFLFMYFASYSLPLLYFVKSKLLVELVYNLVLMAVSYRILSSIFVAPDISFYRE